MQDCKPTITVKHIADLTSAEPHWLGARKLKHFKNSGSALKEHYKKIFQSEEKC